MLKAHSDDSAFLNYPEIDKALAEKLRKNFKKYKELGGRDASAIEKIKSKAGANIWVSQIPCLILISTIFKDFLKFVNIL
jgi:hypothetical protein